MIEDAVELSADKQGLKIHAEAGKDEGTFTIQANNADVLVAFMLKRQRQCRGWTIRNVAHRMNSTSPTAYGQYELGKRIPSIKKLMELLRAIDPTLIPILKTG
jgi:hypothetical protein